MKTILVDSNVILDVLLKRSPHFAASSQIWAAVESGSTRGLLAAHGITTIHHLIARELGTPQANRVIFSVLCVFAVAPVDGAVMQAAIRLPFTDFEDAVTAAAARIAGCDSIVTRDPKGFHRTTPPPASIK